MQAYIVQAKDLMQVKLVILAEQTGSEFLS